MRRALVYYLYGNRNAGDMAICLGAVELLRKQGYEITMVSRFSEAEEEYARSKAYISGYHPYVKVCPGPFSFDRSFPAAKRLAAGWDAALKVSGIAPDRKTRELIAASDAVFLNGGNLLRGASAADYMRLAALFYPIKIAHNMGKPVYCLPQSTAEINAVGEALLRKYLRNFDRVYVREALSYEKLTKRFPQIRFTESADLAFLCGDTETAREKFLDLHLDTGGRNAALVVRNTGIGDIGELAEEKQAALLDRLAGFAAAHRGYRYWIVVQTEKDRAFSQKAFGRLQSAVQVQIIENRDPLVLREIYRNMDFLVTMRLHAGILSLSVKTPAVGLFSTEWGLKNPGVMSGCGMPYVMIEEDDGKELTVPHGGEAAPQILNGRRL